MKFWQAMKALEEGKKIRGFDWDEGHFIVMLNGVVFDNDSNETRLEIRSEQFIEKDWELFEEVEELWQWRYNEQDRGWFLCTRLLTESGAKAYFNPSVHEKHAGPFKVGSHVE